MHARDGETDFLSLSFPPNTWHSVCGTWQSESGLAPLWLDGKKSIKRSIRTGSINGAPITVLGQEQDASGGDFDIKQSFIGMITQVHMWNHVLPNSEIKNLYGWQTIHSRQCVQPGKAGLSSEKADFCEGRACYVTGCKTVNLSPHLLKLSLY